LRMALQGQIEKVRDVVPRTVNFLSEVWSELKKVHWPTRKETYAATIVVLDDHSPDETANYAAGLSKHLGHITVIDQPDNSDAPWQAGSEYAAAHGYDIVVELHRNHSVMQPARTAVAGGA